VYFLLGFILRRF